MEKGKFVDLYSKWNEQGTLKENLMVLSLLVRSNYQEKDIAKHFEISLDNLKQLKKLYPDFNNALDKNNLGAMIECFKTLIKIANGYSKKVPRKQYYKNKKGEDIFFYFIYIRSNSE